jgi:glyoxylase-like metal-dependent hydrolase (beta-lactamase superfamily II)
MAKRQEQEAAREDVTEVAPGVLRMELPISMPGLGHVNCYALIDGEGAALVDPGLPTPGSFKALEQRLARADLKVKDVHTVIVTHSHPDHFGGAVRLVKETGARLLAHVSFRMGIGDTAPEVSVDDLHVHHGHPTHGESPAEAEAGPVDLVPVRDPFTPQFPMRRGGVTPWGGDHPRPPFKMRARWAAMRLMGSAFKFPAVSHPVSRGDVLRLCGREWFVVHTPGHTEDHICLHDPEEQVFLAGDHVLPTITPHISGITHADDPLKLFFDSLDQVAELPNVGQVLPAHGHPFDDLAARCEAIKRHHDERLEKVHSIARELGPATVEAFTQKLFRQRSWGAMAESETYAHLEHIRLMGSAEYHRDEEGKLVYEF